MRNYRLYHCILAFVFFLVFKPLDLRSEEASEPLHFAILPCRDVVLSFKKFQPLIAFLEKRSGIPIQLVIPGDFEQFERSMRSGEIDFVFQDPHTYVRLAHMYDQYSLVKALSLEGTSVQSGVLIVRKDSKIRSVQDLRGKDVMFGPELSAAKWLAAKLMFEEHGIDINKDLRSYSNGGCCEDIAFHVYLKTVDAGVVCDHFLGAHLKKQKELGVEATQLINIINTGFVPSRVFAARKDLEPEIAGTVRAALLQLDRRNAEHAAILESAEVGGFEVSYDAEYDGIRRLLEHME